MTNPPPWDQRPGKTLDVDRHPLARLQGRKCRPCPHWDGCPTGECDALDRPVYDEPEDP